MYDGSPFVYFLGTKSAKFETSPKKIPRYITLSMTSAFHVMKPQTTFPVFFCETIAQHVCLSKEYENLRKGQLACPIQGMLLC